MPKNEQTGLLKVELFTDIKYPGGVATLPKGVYYIRSNCPGGTTVEIITNEIENLRETKLGKEIL